MGHRPDGGRAWRLISAAAPLASRRPHEQDAATHQAARRPGNPGPPAPALATPAHLQAVPARLVRALAVPALLVPAAPGVLALAVPALAGLIPGVLALAGLVPAVLAGDVVPLAGLVVAVLRRENGTSGEPVLDVGPLGPRQAAMALALDRQMNPAAFAAMARRLGGHAVSGQRGPGLPARARREDAATAHALVTATISAVAGTTALVTAVRPVLGGPVAKAHEAEPHEPPGTTL